MSDVAVPLVLLGIPFHNLTFDEALQWIEQRMAAGGPPGYIATVNLDFVRIAHRDPELHRILLEADLCLADGQPMVDLSRHLGPPLRERVTGSDITPMLATRCRDLQRSLFCLGGAPGVARDAARLMQQRNPGLRIAGHHAPPFAPIDQMDHAAILEQLEATQPDLLLVAFGAPKQEKWIAMHYRHWQVPVAIGVGGSLDFIAGRQTRAPRWVQRLRAEWVWRLGTHPRRFLGRYARDAFFLLSMGLRLLGLHLMPRHPASGTIPPDPACPGETGALPMAWVPLPDMDAAAARWHELRHIPPGQPILFDMQPARHLASHELGLLVQLAKRPPRGKPRIHLWNPQPRVARLLELYRLDHYLPIHRPAPRTAPEHSALTPAPEKR